MPWTASGFRKHNLKASPSQAEKGARIANAVLKRGVPEGEALAIANKSIARRAGGGPIWDAAAAGPQYGFIPSSVGGRTDHLPRVPEADAFVIPADVVSALGEGNSLAGALILDQVFHGHTAKPQHSARGGATRVPVMMAGGEYVIPPRAVIAFGGGDARKGHKVLAAWVKQTRAKLVDKLKKLPGPVH